MSHFFVYRVESRNGLGPYRDATNFNYSYICSGPSRPVPWDDGIVFVEQHDLFGFSSVGKLKQWFSKALPLLEKDGYRISVYKVPVVAVKRGKKQVAFDSLSGAHRIKVLPISQVLS